MFDLFSPPSKFPYDDASEWIVGGGSPSHSYANVIRGGSTTLMRLFGMLEEDS